MSRGGKRYGSGRKLGSKSKDRPKIRDYIKDFEIKDLVNTCKKLALEGRPELMKFLLEQVFGKAMQPIGNDGDEPFKIAGVDIVIRK